MIQSLYLFLKAGHLNKASLFGCSQLCCVSPKEGAVVKQMQSKVIRERGQSAAPILTPDVV